VKPRARDVLGAAILTFVLLALVAVIFIGALGEADRAPDREARAAAVAAWQP
jgi:hypothetical protein